MNPPPSDLADTSVATVTDKGVVGIVIVNWNAGDQLRDCLTSIVRNGHETVRSVVVVDNASTDGSADVEIPELPFAVIKSDINLGFGRACNLGAAQIDAPLLLFLNPDGALLSDGLAKAVAFLNSDAGRLVGVLGVQLLNEQGKVHHHTTMRAVARTIFTHDQRAVRFDHLESRGVDHVIGAFYLIRAEIFRALGGFDERFFVYLEDVDLSARVQDAGWQIHYLADAQAYHKGGGTSEKVKAKRLFYSLRSRILYSFKHFPVGQAVMVTGVTLVAEPFLRLGRALKRRSGREAHETLTAFAYLYRDLPGIARLVFRKGRE